MSLLLLSLLLLTQHLRKLT